MNLHHPAHTPHKSVGKHPDRSAATPRRVSARPTVEPSDTYAGGFSAILRRYPLSLGLTSLGGVILLTALSLVAYQSPDPTALLSLCSAAALLLTALWGGLVAGKGNPAAPLTAGGVYGCMTAVLLTVAALLLEGDFSLMGWGLRLSVIPLHWLGSCLTRPRRRKHSHTGGKHPPRK